MDTSLENKQSHVFRLQNAQRLFSQWCESHVVSEEHITEVSFHDVPSCLLRSSFLSKTTQFLKIWEGLRSYLWVGVAFLRTVDEPLCPPKPSSARCVLVSPVDQIRPFLPSGATALTEEGRDLEVETVELNSKASFLSTHFPSSFLSFSVSYGTFSVTLS